MGLFKALWGWITVVLGEYVGLFLLTLFTLALLPLFFYTGELLLFCLLPGYRIRRKPLDPEPLPEYKWLSENSIFVGFFFWALLLSLPYILS